MIHELSDNSMSYELKNWNEEVMKWLAVAMILAIAGMAVMPSVSVVEFNYGWVASGFGFAWSVGHGDAVGAIASGIGAVAALVSLACLPATAPLWLIALAY